MKNIFIVLLMLSLSGCGFLLNFDAHDSGRKIYGGVRLDLNGHLWNDDIIGYLDLPFSLAIDTFLLPLHLVMEASRG